VGLKNNNLCLKLSEKDEEIEELLGIIE